MKKLILITLAFTAIGCASTASKITNIGTPDILPVIDTHTHTDFSGIPEETSGIPETEAQYLKERAENNVVASITHLGRNGAGYSENLAKQNVFHCYGTPDKPDLKTLEAGLKSKKYRCIKVYLGYVYKFPTDAAYKPVYNLALKYNVPVVFHTGDTYTSKGKLKFADPLLIDEIAVDYPDMTIVIAHLGNPWTQMAAEVAYKNPNVYVEASAMLIGDLNKTSKESLNSLLIEPLKWAYNYMESGDKIMFGTDWPLVGMKEYIAAYKQAIPREHWCKVFYQNAIKVFRLKELEGKHTCNVK